MSHICMNSVKQYLVLIRTCLVLCKHAAGPDTSGLSTLATDAARQLDILGHDGHTLGVDGAQVGVFKQTNQVGLAGLLQGHDCAALEAKIGLEVLSDLTNQTLERQLADEQFRALLVATDLTQRDRSGAVAMRLLHTSGGRGALASRLSGQLLAGRLATRGLASRLLGTRHFSNCGSQRLLRQASFHLHTDAGASAHAQ